MSDENEDTLREWLTAEQLVYCEGEWSDGDSVYGVTQFTNKQREPRGRIFTEGGERFENAEDRGREFFATGFPPQDVHTSVFFHGTVNAFPAKPPMKTSSDAPQVEYVTFADVDILDWTDHRGEVDE